MSRRINWINFSTTLLLVSFSAALLAYAGLGYFTRYMADDYCTANAIAAKGFVSAQRDWYVGWTGRFSFTFAVSVAGLMGPAAVPFCPRWRWHGGWREPLGPSIRSRPSPAGRARSQLRS